MTQHPGADEKAGWWRSSRIRRWDWQIGSVTAAGRQDAREICLKQLAGAVWRRLMLVLSG